MILIKNNFRVVSLLYDLRYNSDLNPRLEIIWIDMTYDEGITFVGLNWSGVGMSFKC